MEILDGVGGKHPLLRLPREMREALAAYVAINAPTGRRGWAQKRWDLTADQARAVCDGTASLATIEKVFKHPNGGWAVLLPVMGAVIGQPLSDFFRQQIRNAAHEQERAQEHERLAHAAYARLGDRLVLDPGSDRDAAPSVREAGHGAGEMGAEASQRVGRT